MIFFFSVWGNKRGSDSALCLQNVYYTSSQQLHLGVLSPTIDDDDNKCLVDVNGRPRLLECSYASSKHMKLTWTFSQVRLAELAPGLTRFTSTWFSDLVSLLTWFPAAGSQHV